MTVEFTVHSVQILPAGDHEVHLLIGDELATLIQQLCEDEFADDVLSVVKEWKLANTPDDGD